MSQKKKAGGERTKANSTRSLRDNAEEYLVRSPKISSDPAGQTPEELIHILRVHQVELETQAEELRTAHLGLGESRDKYLDLYDFAPVGYFTLTDKALVKEANLACATLLGVERNNLVNHGLGRFIAQPDLDMWDQYFMNILNQDTKQTCTLTLIRGDGSTFPARLEGVRLTSINDIATTVRVAISDISDIRLAEQALRESENKYRKLVETTDTGFVILDDQGQVLDANLKYIVLTGHTSLEEIAGKKVTDWTAAYHKDKNAEAVRQCMLCGYIRNLEIDHVNASGTVIPLEINATVFRSGNTAHILALCRDITGRKLAEEALRESELLFRAVFNNANDSVFLLERTPDGPGKYILVNDKAVRMLGYSREELLEMSPRDIVPEDIAKKIMPDVIKKLLKDGHATFESSHRRKDGSTYPIEVSTHTFCYKGKDVDLSIVRDITGRKRDEETIRQSEEKFRLVVENDPDAIFIQTEGQFAYVNPAACRLFGAGSTDLLIGKQVLDRFHPDFREIVKERIHVLNDERQPVSRIEEIYLRLDGTPFDVEVSAVPMTYLQKDGALVFFNDITERKKSEQTIQHALREKEVLLREVHHRVKNNLAGIISLIGLQVSSVTDPATISLLKDLETRIRSMALVHESLYRTKDLARVNVANYTKNLTGHLFQVYEKSASIQCRIEMEEITIPIETAIPCGLVMTEIVTNSLKYAFPDTFSCMEIRGVPCTIALTLQRDGNDYLLSVADNGIGMPEGTDVPMHHSLGLYLIRLVVEHQLRGSLEISTAGGTAYTIRFPEPAVKERNADE